METASSSPESVPGTCGRKVLPLPCVHRGEPTGQKVECPTCNGRVELKVFTCEIHESCTIKKKVDGHACCEGCPQKSC